MTSGVLLPQTMVCPAGEKEWVPLTDFKFSPESTTIIAKKKVEVVPLGGENTPVDHQAIAAAGNDADEDKPEEEKGPSRYQLIKSIRADFDLLWKAQRESLISQIKGLELDDEYETTRRQAKAIKARVKESVMQYWHKTRAYEGWIEDLVWNDCDLQRRLRGEGCLSKYEDAKRWLEEAKLIEESGCYCFKENKNYLYIGKSDNLGERLKQHRHAVWFEQSTHLRIIIPRYKGWTSKLERLLLLSYPDALYNDATPSKGNNPVDDILELLEKEMNELLTDG